MKDRPKIRWIVVLSFIMIISAYNHVGGVSKGKTGGVGTQTCIDCHQTWQDNNPPVEDIVSGITSIDYLPLNLYSSHEESPFYTIPEGYVSSTHYTPPSNLSLYDNVTCEGCHGSGLGHYGVGSIPVPIPDIKTCTGCHNPAHGFDVNTFLLTSHANKNNKPGKLFDQTIYGTGQAKTSTLTPNAESGLPLFKQGTFSPEGDPVSRNERIEECSVCHSYALQYPQFRKKIAQGNLPMKPEVSCGACHDSHIPAPSGINPAIVTSTVVITAVTGSGTGTATSVEAAAGRKMSYLNHKPYKLGDSGAQDTSNGIWTRGSAINRPQTALIKGACAVTTGSEGTCNVITLNCDPCLAQGGFLKNGVKEGDTIFISGVASATVNLPADAKLAGKPITLQATLDMDGHQVIQVIDDKTIIIDPPIVTSTNVTYVKTDGKTATLSATSVPPLQVSFCGTTVNFEIRDMYSNTADLCGSCHTQGTYKYTQWGKKKDKTLIDLSPTHNINVAGQYKTSGHANKLAPPWEEFTAFGGHQLNYPYDMSITGSGGVGSLRNKGNKTYKLTSTPDNTQAYLIAAGNTNQPTTTGSFNCLQCHNGLTSIDYQKDVQGTSAASVVWGDSTVTCITCHDPHADQTGSGKNIRVPVKLSFNSYFVDATKNPRGGINKFLDGTDIPSGVGDGIICLFCHQGRESGLTIYSNIKKNTTVDPYTDPDKRLTGISSFQNPHYLESGAVIWSKNTWEYFFNGTPQKYSSGNTSHQQMNCTGCHMGEASPNNFEGGHTWRPRIETCQTCHGRIDNFQAVQASADYDGDGTVKTAFEEIGTLSPDTGLFGQLKAALQAKGIYYNPDLYPYFFSNAAFTSNYSAWTTNTLTASFNLTFFYKAGNCAYVHNSKYVAQILQDSLKALGVSKPWFRPTGDRNATDYRTIVVNP